jgi:hypothetical protein
MKPPRDIIQKIKTNFMQGGKFFKRAPKAIQLHQYFNFFETFFVFSKHLF